MKLCGAGAGKFTGLVETSCKLDYIGILVTDELEACDI